MKITNLSALEVLDSRGNPTIEVSLEIDNQFSARAIVPSGASTGEKEALELRDKDKNRFVGKGVLKAISNIENLIKKAVLNQSFNQKSLDDLMINLDGTENKSKLGANAILAVSMAFFKASSKAKSKQLFEMNINGFSENQNLLPTPMMNIINGGAHANNSVDIQEFMIIPSAQNFSQSLRYGVEVFHALASILKKGSFSTAVGDEGGFAPDLSSNIHAIEVILEAIELAGFKAGKDIYLALDVASSEFYQNGKYNLGSENISFSSEKFIDYLKKLTVQYPIVSIEDGLDENDNEGWKVLTRELNHIQLVGDDLLVTNPKLLNKAIEEKTANAILIKLNQVGTVSETLECIALAQKSNFGVVISHRSGESEDFTIADLAVATSAGQIKTGSLSRTDRICKYNQLLRIEKYLGTQARYLGIKSLNLL